MESAAECAAEYVRAPSKALEDLRDALARFEQAYNPTLVEPDENRDSDMWRISQNGHVNRTDMSVCERLKFVFRCVALAGKREPELFGVLTPRQNCPDVVSWISWFIRTANGRETFCLAVYPLWEFEQKLEAFEFEILTSNRFVRPSSTNATPLGTSGEHEEQTPRKPTNSIAVWPDMWGNIAFCASEYFRTPKKVLGDIQDALARFDQAWGATLVETDCDTMVWRFAKKGPGDLAELVVSDRLKFIAQCVAFVSKWEPDLFGRVVSELSETSWGTNLETFLTSANPKGEETFYLDDHPFGELMESLNHFSDMLEFERLSKTGVEAPTPDVVNLAIKANAASGNEPAIATVETASILIDKKNGDKGKDPPDGIDDSMMIFRWGGRVVEGFTPTGFDVLKAMWGMLDNAEHRIRRVDVAEFLPKRMATWDFDPDLKSFSKYQTEIRKAFKAAGMPCPWEFSTRTKHYVKSAVYCAVDDR